MPFLVAPSTSFPDNCGILVFMTVAFLTTFVSIEALDLILPFAVLVYKLFMFVRLLVLFSNEVLLWIKFWLVSRPSVVVSSLYHFF